MKLLYNPHFRMQTIQTGAITGISYSFFPNKPTPVKDEDVSAFLERGFKIWTKPKIKTETKSKRIYSRRRKK